jgi:hypothetical protein
MMFQAKEYTQPWCNAYQVNTIKQEIIRSCDTFKKKQLLSAKIDLSVFTEKGLGLLKKQINQHETELLNKEKISRSAITVHQPVIDQPVDRPPADPQPFDPPPALARYEWPDPAETSDATSSSWYRTLPSMIGFFFLVSLLPVVACGSVTYFLPKIEEIGNFYKFMDAVKNGLALLTILAFLSSIFLCVYGASLQNSLHLLPNFTNLFREVFSIDKKNENKKKIFGYVRLKIFHLLPKDFYEKMFKRNYKNLLEDLKEKNLLTIEEICILTNADMNLHEEIVNEWIWHLVAGSQSAKTAFLKFDKECTNFKSKYFTMKDLVERTCIPFCKWMIALNIPRNFVDFSGLGTVEELLNKFPYQAVVLLMLIMVIFYIGLYTLDVFNVNNYFFNGIKKNAVNIKEFYEEQERKLTEVKFSRDLVI